MKSIKEKAKWESADPFKQGWFEAGANYVLEQIEKLLDEFSNFEDSLIIRRAVEELKSNQ